MGEPDGVYRLGPAGAELLHGLKRCVPGASYAADGGVVYKARVPQPELISGWKTVSVPLPRFANEKGASPASWSKVDRIQITGVTAKSQPPLFSRFRWVMP